MEKKVEFELSSSTALYLCKHFNSISNSEQILLEKNALKKDIQNFLFEIGSKFQSDFVGGPFSLISLLNDSIPTQIILQKNGRTAYIFTFEYKVGTSNIIQLSSIPFNKLDKVKKIKRGPFQVLSYATNDKILTNQIVLISENNYVITCFPGIYAPPLPSLELPDSERNESLFFWQKHAFVEYEK